ncbi:Type-1 restriction enzyme R protein (plasmid) [Mesomycoplasma conjunctivae]|nr:DEAD/DEAH box helicase family protein [Mycoplasmopsis fermentans]ADV34596.1 Type I restriction-modification system, R subunit [Mycoplasmopsis fermentans M64]VEU63931.1 Type-1 restriction enzyme R protein [Mycoplasmopsis fermentans]VEU67079.1 Type-1 restriction enzyme R protein [Mesomycoplasma conjunctivae]
MNKKNTINEEEVKLRFITPALERAGWDKNFINMEYYISAGKVIFENGEAKKLKAKRIDYLLNYNGDGSPLAIIEAKGEDHKEGDGLLQAQNYAKRLGVRFVFTSNGNNFRFYDMKTGIEKTIGLDEFFTPDELFEMTYGEEIKENKALEKIISTPYYYGQNSHIPRYYQKRAINDTVDAVAKGKDRILLVMATGTGKTYVAFQIIWRLWKSGLKKKILYLADRNILIDQTIIGDFKPFKNSMVKVSKRNMDTSYEIYLSLYQQLSENGSEDSLKKLKESFKPDFFDLIIVDECHRGSASEDSKWREILNYFDSATKIGLTATPKETAEVSNIDYFGEPIYTYSLKEGIEDGYLAPYKVVKFGINTDVFGYRPEKDKRDKYGEIVEDNEYNVKDFDKTIVIEERTKEVAKKITDYLKSINNRYAKTIVFCDDIEHAERMRQALVHYNSDMMAKDHRYIVRITGDNEEGKKQLDNFIDDNELYPTIVTTSELMTTGVNCKLCRVIALDNTFGENGMTKFKQIIGRGTRIKEFDDPKDKHKNKLYFTILDFKNATKLFADPDFNGPAIQEEFFNPEILRNKKAKQETKKEYELVDEGLVWKENSEQNKSNRRKKIYVNGVDVELIYKKVNYYDDEGKLIIEPIEDFVKRNVLKNYNTIQDFVKYWTSNKTRSTIIQELMSKGILIENLRNIYPRDFDDFDLICSIAYGSKLLKRSERVNNKKVVQIIERQNVETCRKILQILINKYQEEVIDELTDNNNLRLKEFEQFGGPLKIAKLFGGKEQYIQTVKEIQKALYIV